MPKRNHPSQSDTPPAKGAVLPLRLSAAHLATIEAAASVAGIDRSAFVRQAAIRSAARTLSKKVA
jgi:uncharacterized protein (DUF1778 family)